MQSWAAIIKFSLLLTLFRLSQHYPCSLRRAYFTIISPLETYKMHASWINIFFRKINKNHTESIRKTRWFANCATPEFVIACIVAQFRNMMLSNCIFWSITNVKFICNSALVVWQIFHKWHKDLRLENASVNKHFLVLQIAIIIFRPNILALGGSHYLFQMILKTPQT